MFFEFRIFFRLRQKFRNIYRSQRSIVSRAQELSETVNFRAHESKDHGPVVPSALLELKVMNWDLQLCKFRQHQEQGSQYSDSPSFVG